MKRIAVSETKERVGKEVTIAGWVDTRRDHGKLIFFDVRDRSGKVQLVIPPNDAALHALAQTLRPEWVVAVTGGVAARPDAMKNSDESLGNIEIKVSAIEVINEAATPPFPIDTDGHDIDEETRNKYRYLDLRRDRMKNNIRIYHEVAHFIRNHLISKGFWEIQTPILTKSTPEGARDFLVPSRLQQGKFYALPQSPQQYKQLLMIAGMEKYFQIARCFRDEDPRADRAYGEFTQVDIEMSFVDQEDILRLAEEMFTELVKKVFPEKRIKQTPWPRLTHKEAQEKYGTDKPDLRENKNDPNELAFAWVLDFPLFTEQSDKDFFHGSGSAKFAPSHHMFTAPHPDDVPLLDTDPQKVRGLQHDMVLNGYEVGGGSVRIHSREVQEKIFDLIGFSREQKEQFAYFLEAFKYGAPPHGGIAPGLDRFIYVALGETSIREVIAFPAVSSGQTAVMDAPSEVSEKQLKELHIRTEK